MSVAVPLVALSGPPATALVPLGTHAVGMVVLLLATTALSVLGRGHVLRLLSKWTERLSRVAGVLLALARVAQSYLSYFDFDWLGGLEALGLL